MKPDFIHLCVTLIMTIVFLAVAGCTDSPQNQHDQMSVGEKPGGLPAAGVTITTRITTAPSPLKTLPQATATYPSVAAVTTRMSDPSERAAPNGILIDGIPDIIAGDPLVVSGRTSLPVGTDLIVQVVPVTTDNGKIAGDYRNTEKSATTKVAGGSTNGNRYSVTIETENLLPAEHIVSVSDLEDEKADSSSGPVGVTGSALFIIIAR
ncbi:MAG: hypothetical protein WC379_14170 [Methanoregula sp.]